MKDKEKQVRHIRAARDWLGEAEASVQADEGVRGGLKLMLAEAELAGMRETKPGRMRRFFGRGAPLIAACLIAAGAALFYRAGSLPFPRWHGRKHRKRRAHFRTRLWTQRRIRKWALRQSVPLMRRYKRNAARCRRSRCRRAQQPHHAWRRRRGAQRLFSSKAPLQKYPMRRYRN